MNVILLAAILTAAPADQWPAFRGTGDSITEAVHLPVEWSEDSGVAWRAEITGAGQSSPVVWKNNVVVTSTEGPNKERSIVACFDTETGKPKWQKAIEAAEPEKVSNYISRAAPTPAVDSERVYAFFETGNLIALSHTGELLWNRPLTEEYGKFAGNHGLGSSIALSDDAVIVLIDHEGPSYLLAVDKATGKNLWKKAREQRVAWSSPIVSGDQLIVSSNGTCAAYRLAGGEKLWTVEGLEGNTVPSATADEKLVVVGSSDVGNNLAIRRGGTGNVTESNIAWRAATATATFSSPLVYQGQVYMVSRAGIAYCLDQQSGELRWNERIGTSCWASPLGGCDRVYFFGKNGTTTVVEAGTKLNVLAENKLPTDDIVYGVAAVTGKFFVRTGDELICIANESSNRKPSDMPTKQSKAEKPAYPELPRAITNFGAAKIGDIAYVYGGHHGKAHHYYDEGQSEELLALDTSDPDGEWQVLAKGPRIQGLALEAHNGKLYRAGGFEARNTEEEDQNLWSLADFARFDTATGKWKELPPMPEPRSSFDATVLGDTMYVVGGWAMQGDKETTWHHTAYSIDLSKENLQWKKLPDAPFQRRAISVAVHGGKIYVVGGMQPNGKVTRKTAVFDPKSNEWSEGPKLPDEQMEGFGTAARTTGDDLYVSTSSGNLLRLSDDGKSWQVVQQMDVGRFFHQMLPVGKDRLLLIGGANMQQGKFSTTEAVETKSK